MEITSISSRGQVVIPQSLREKMKIHEGEKFVVLGEDSTIILKKIEMPSFKGFDKLIEKTRKFVKEKNIKEGDIEEAIKQARKK